MNGVEHKFFDLQSLTPSTCPMRYFIALIIADSSVARNFETANDLCKSDLAKSVANNLDANGKQTSRLLWNRSLICSSLVYHRECANGTEKHHYLHSWAHLTPAMANDLYTDFLYQIHYDKLIAGRLGEQHHKTSIISGFNFPQNSLSFDRLQSILMHK